MRSIAVFCGSSSGSDETYQKEARLLGETLAKRKIRLVYGGAKVGLMGAVSNSALEAGGEVIGVIPGFLRKKEIAHEQLTQLILVESMHERKIKMNELCDGVIALPGGYGTLEEFFEMLTWGQLGLHQKPMGILNTNGYYNDLRTLVDSMVEKGFLKQVNRDMLLMENTIPELLDKMEHYKAPAVGKWIREKEV